VRFTGGFHAQVLWIDGSTRLIYFLGPDWTRKRVRNLLTLLQMKAVHVYGLAPKDVVLVDVKRKELLEARPPDPDLERLAQSTAAWMHERFVSGVAS
jgi:hypothetical protein